MYGRRKADASAAEANIYPSELQGREAYEALLDAIRSLVRRKSDEAQLRGGLIRYRCCGLVSPASDLPLPAIGQCNGELLVDLEVTEPLT
ncbi:hypothetical protein SK3146_02105 [Paenibacillus konkukensis]|uniref:Uncharacterized protein n=1 Tax=Paenibacillus konkukensis TaxID=2020716 RepID=A0ABY4RM02_9BACL|nr:hypothetical protein [Paenibacillus konkukensis]UQZ82945.1 hypothetical protein SK3146_02105 [Paenibacillus konkukensis]